MLAVYFKILNYQNRNSKKSNGHNQNYDNGRMRPTRLGDPIPLQTARKYWYHKM